MYRTTRNSGFKILLWIVSTILILSSFPPRSALAAGLIYRVIPGGISSGACGATWVDACSLQNAINLSTSGNEIWVAAGTYKPTSSADRAISFSLKSGVSLYGGFAGTETTRGGRNPAVNLTILSGDIDNNDSQKPVITNLATVTGNSTNSYHVVVGADGGVLDGFIITAGYANGTSEQASGGGFIFTSLASPSLNNLTFSGNYAALYGGGVYVNVAYPTLTNITFSGNSALIGGGIAGYNASPTLGNITFSGNSAAQDGGGMYQKGGGGTLVNVTFSDNSAVNRGGGMYNDAGYANISNTILWGNTAAMDPQIANFYYYVGEKLSIFKSILPSCPSLSNCSEIITSDPKLGPLGDNGGFTKTHPLLADSSAIDTGDDTNCSASPVNSLDQRGITRPQGAHCDIGAYELVFPTMPTGVNATDGTEFNQVHVSWNPSTYTTYYKVYSNTSNTSSGSTLIGSPTGTGYTDTSATPGITYFYFVKACNAGGCSGFSTSDSGYWILPAPTGVSATDGTYADKVRVSWVASAGADSYEVYRNTTNNISGSVVLGEGTSASPFDDTTAVPGTTYWYFVEACKGGGYSTFSVSDSGYRAISIPLPGAFSKAAPLNLATNRPRNLTLSWNTSGNAIEYKYCLKPAAGTCTWKTTGSNTSVALTGLTSAKYSWQVRAVNATGFTPANGGTWWTFTVPPKPGAFGKIAPLNNSTGKPTNLMLSWSPSTSAGKYEYCIDMTPGTTCTTSWKSTKLNKFVNLTGLLKGKKYYWMVRAMNAVGSTLANGGVWWNFTTAP